MNAEEALANAIANMPGTTAEEAMRNVAEQVGRNKPQSPVEDTHNNTAPLSADGVLPGSSMLLRHEHTYFFALNQNHTALRGCIYCGMTHVTLAAGPDPNALVWHRIKEPEEL